jgi:hypothetical protein
MEDHLSLCTNTCAMSKQKGLLTPIFSLSHKFAGKEILDKKMEITIPSSTWCRVLAATLSRTHGKRSDATTSILWYGFLGPSTCRWRVWGLLQPKAGKLESEEEHAYMVLVSERAGRRNTEGACASCLAPSPRHHQSFLKFEGVGGGGGE